MRKSFSFLVIFILFSCFSVPQPIIKPAPLKEVYLKNIKDFMEQDKLADALQDIDYLDRQNSVKKEELLVLKKQVIEKYTIRFYKLIAEKQFEKAFFVYISLNYAGIETPFTDWSINKLFNAIADKLIEGKQYPAALAVISKAIKHFEVDNQLLQTGLDIAYKLKNRANTKIIIDLLSSKGFPVDNKYNQALSAAPTKAEMMKGTAVIWVDRGIKIESGVGLPDRILGSGFFIDQEGYLLTNYHVISSMVDPEYEGYSRLFIRLSANINEMIPAKVIGYDTILDLALLKVEVKPEYSFCFSESEKIEPGDKIFAIGSPVDPILENTITSGIISATGRRAFLQLGDTVQIDAPVNPGNSGGPLVNENGGELVGIVFAGLQMFEGLNFAITYNWITKMIPKLYRGGEVKHPWLGMAMEQNDKGLRVIYTVPEEPANRADILPGDVITAVNRKSVQTFKDIQEILLDFDADTLVFVEWKRGNVLYSGLVKLSERPFRPIELALKRDYLNNVFMPLFGMSIRKTDSFLWETNYVITEVISGSTADNTGLSPNDALSIQKWIVDEKNHAAYLQIFVKKKKAGFFESIIQVGAPMESDIFI